MQRPGRRRPVRISEQIIDGGYRRRCCNWNAGGDPRWSQHVPNKRGHLRGRLGPHGQTRTELWWKRTHAQALVEITGFSLKVQSPQGPRGLIPLEDLNQAPGS